MLTNLLFFIAGLLIGGITMHFIAKHNQKVETVMGRIDETISEVEDKIKKV